MGELLFQLLIFLYLDRCLNNPYKEGEGLDPQDDGRRNIEPKEKEEVQNDHLLSNHCTSEWNEFHHLLIYIMGALLAKMLESFYARQLEVVIIGLQNSGKTTLLNVLASGAPLETVPTVGMNVKLVKKGGVKLKCWDLGGQEQYRSEWGRYTSGCDVVIYVVDSNAFDTLPTAKHELHRLLEDRSLATTPILVVANKVDLDPHISEQELIRELNLDYIMDNPWIVIPVSALKTTNVDQVVQWLMRQKGRTS